MNHLYYGDNLTVLRDSIADESVDLIYLDPPFNSNATYSHLFKDESGQVSGAQIAAFDDTWHWDDMVSGQALIELRDSPYQEAAKMLDAMVGFLGKNPMTAYLAMMAVRLVELHRVLKPTGSLYLHCDPTASHYLKILLDAVFGAKNFRNEIVWRRYDRPKGSQHKSRRFGRSTDTIFYYSKSDNYFFNSDSIRVSLSTEEIEKRFISKDENGRFMSGPLLRSDSMGSRPNLVFEFQGYTPGPAGWRMKKEKLQEIFDRGDFYFTSNGVPRRKFRPSDEPGTSVDNLWDDISALSAHDQERLGYPTQKPVALLERILNASSNPGDVVLDPFCGCGTTVHAAQKLGRQWIGIDITHLAINLIETRLYDAFEGQAEFTVHGVPQDIGGARDFFERDDKTKKEFEKWACGLIKAYPQGGGKKGADGGIDGLFRFGPAREHTAIVSVKGGKNVGVAMVKDLDATVTEQKAAIGVFLTLTPPTKPMLDWARGAGTFQVEGFDPVPRLQIVTIEEAMEKGPRAVNTPLRHGNPYKRAAREEDTRAQGALDL
ncbi:MAG: site-specific DNA-methyltransferase [Roseovarius sp.]|nr:site-specific DNA-methyltransferase [Roseovarius sp.]